jgi:quercetin dioxygenase-like cupin family protein
MVMLEGIVTVISPEESAVLHAGDSVIFKAGIPHRIENTGATDAQWLIISVAGVKFFRENGDEAIPGWAK